MGWSGHFIEKDEIVNFLVTKTFRKQFTAISYTSPRRCKHDPGNKVIYAAMIDKETNAIFAAVFMYHYNKRYKELLYKIETEHCGPIETNCPKKILNLLTPLDPSEEYAKAWRMQCMEIPTK